MKNQCQLSFYLEVVLTNIITIILGFFQFHQLYEYRFKFSAQTLIRTANPTRGRQRNFVKTKTNYSSLRLLDFLNKFDFSSVSGAFRLFYQFTSNHHGTFREVNEKSCGSGNKLTEKSHKN